MNNVKTFMLMAGLMALFLGLGQMIAGQQGLIMALVLGSAMNFIMYFFSDRMVLAMYRARVVTREGCARALSHGGPAAPARRACPCPGSPSPSRSSPTRSPPAATRARPSSRSRPGILRYMPPEELEGVIAHELAHIKNRDMLISTIAAGVAGAIGYLPYLLMFGGGRGTTARRPSVRWRSRPWSSARSRR